MDSSADGNDTSIPPWADGALPANSHESRSELILIIGIITSILTTIFVALRVYVRGFLIKKWGADDTLLVFAFFAVVLHNSMMCLATKFGLGKHVWVTPAHTLIRGQKLALFIIIVYQVAFITIKITFLLQYRRVFPLPRVEFLCNMGIAFLILFGISLLVSAGVTYAIAYKYNFWNSPISVENWWLANAAIHLATDILIFFLPIPLLRRLQMKTTQRLALMASFGLGFLTCAVSVIRIASLPYSFRTTDTTYEGTPTIVWTMIELACAVICCCIPTLRPLTRVSQYSSRGTRTTGSGYNSTLASLPQAPPQPPPINDRVSSSISCESDSVPRKHTSSFFWQRSRQQSDNSTVGGTDEIEPVLTMPTTPVTPRTPKPPVGLKIATPVQMEMPILEVNGLRRHSEATVDSSGMPKRTRSMRSSLRSDGSGGMGGGLSRELRVRRRMSVALTERDSDDDLYYFGVDEEDVDIECPTPLSPPPKGRQSMSETR